MKKWDNEKIVLLTESNKEISVAIKDFHKIFRVAYCVTIHSCQCMTIEGSIGLYNVGLYSRRMAYTAVTRAKNLNQIFVSALTPTDIIFQEDDLSFYTRPIYANDNKGYLYGLMNSFDEKFYHVDVCKDIETEIARIRRETEANCHSKLSKANCHSKLSKAINEQKLQINYVVIKEYPSVDIVRRKIDEIRQRFLEEDHPLIIQPLKCKVAHKPREGKTISKKTQSIGKIICYTNRKKETLGYQYRITDKNSGKSISKTFSIKNYGTLEKAKEAAEEYRFEQSN